MSKSEEFQQYAEEVMDWIKNCTDPIEKTTLISLAQAWLKAAGRGDNPVRAKKPSEHGTA